MKMREEIRAFLIVENLLIESANDIIYIGVFLKSYSLILKTHKHKA